MKKKTKKKQQIAEETDPMRKIGILTGGGDCPGLNAVIRGVVEKCSKVSVITNPFFS